MSVPACIANAIADALAVKDVPNTSSLRFHFVPFTDTPALARRSIAVKAKSWVLPSFHPSRMKNPASCVMACSRFTPVPYFSVPQRLTASTFGVVPVCSPSLMASA